MYNTEFVKRINIKNIIIICSIIEMNRFLYARTRGSTQNKWIII